MSSEKDLLLRLHLTYHEASGEIRELVDAGVSPSRIYALYPVEHVAYASKLDRWLSNVPGVAYRNSTTLGLPSHVVRWQLADKQASRQAYIDSGHAQRHLDLMADHLSSAFTASKEEFLFDLHDAIYFLSHWEEASRIAAMADPKLLLGKYVSTWGEHLLMQPNFVRTLNLDLTTGLGIAFAP